MSTIQIATMHSGKGEKTENISIPIPGLNITPPPWTNELLLCVPQQKTEATFTYLPHYWQWDALDCCYSFQKGPCCPRMICSATLPHHRSIALSHQSFRRCRADDLIQLVIQLLLRIAGATQIQHWGRPLPPTEPFLPSH